uniref:Uncharacterized protein n=1 Tax=Solanum lycopersicum TaxID=4081 RepID=A0A3Q7FN04_SOLLC
MNPLSILVHVQEIIALVHSVPIKMKIVTVVSKSLKSRTLSEYLGLETMLAVVCKTHDGLKALLTYDKKGPMNKCSDLHGDGASIRRPLDDRYLVICLENLRFEHFRPKKPRYVKEETPPDFLGFCVIRTGHGLRETLFYGLFSQLQVYKTREDMMQALPFITDGAISLDGGIIKSGGIFSLGRETLKNQLSTTKEVQIKFPKSSGRLYLRESVEDLEREQTLLTNAKNNFEIRKEEFFKFLSQSSSYL